MSDDDSLGSAGDDDVQVAAQISSMLKPLTKKQSKMGKRLSALEGVEFAPMPPPGRPSPPGRPRSREHSFAD